MKLVIKRNEEFQPFKKEKIVRTAMRSGLVRVDAQRVANQIEKSFGEKIRAKELYRRVLRLIEKISKTACCRYQIKEAVTKIDPELFEMYVQKVLQRNGYKAVWNRIIQGDAIEHQVDVLATKNNITYLVECKHHINITRDTGMGKVLQVWARLLDVQDGSKKKKNPYKNCNAWMVTNTKFSMHARKFAKAKDIRLSGWGSGTFSLQKLIETKQSYPTNILNVDPKTQQRCEQANLLTIVDILEQEDKAREIFGKKYSEVIDKIYKLMEKK